MVWKHVWRVDDQADVGNDERPDFFKSGHDYAGVFASKLL